MTFSQDSSFLIRARDWAAASHLRAVVVLLLFALAIFLPGQSTLQPMDRDEPRFAQATKQMLESRDFIDIRFQDEARHKKPVGIYWLQSITVAAGEALGVSDARRQIWLYRLPSLIGAVATVLLTYWALLAVLSPGLALLSAAAMAACVLLGVEARLAKTDAVLAACSVAAMGALLRVWLDWRRLLPFALHRHNWLVFWGANAVAVLVKGPILPMVWGLAAVVLSIKARGVHWLRLLNPARGLLIVLVAVLPWFIAIMIKSGGSFLSDSLGKDMLGKVAEGQEKHGAPPGFYLLAFFGTFWPLAALSAMSALHAFRNRAADQFAFLLAWIIPSWIVFEAVPTKLPHYVLPMYPAIAALTFLAIRDNGIEMWRRGAVATTWLVGIIPTVLVMGACVAAWQLDRTLPFFALPLLLAGVALAWWAVRALAQGAFEEGILRALVASLAIAIGVYGFAQNDLRALKLSPRLADVARNVGCADPRIVTAGYREPSLVFLTSTDIAMLPGAGAAQFLMQPGCRIAFVTNREIAAFETEAAKIGLVARRLTTISGFNLNGGRKLDIAVLVSGV